MPRGFLRPSWLAAHLVVTAITIVFVMLGMWQLDRLDQRRAENEAGESRFTQAPADPEDLVSLPAESLGYRRVVVDGVFDPENEVLIRSQVHLGNAGFHVITPLVGESGETVLVNRGWLPLGLDQVPAAEAPPPPGLTSIEGWVHLTQERPSLGPEDPPEGRLSHMNRVDITRIQQQVPYTLAPVYLVEVAEQRTDLPIPEEAPSFDDEGPHLGYAIQWFGFAVVLVVGWIFFVRRQTTSRSQVGSAARASPSTTS